MLPLFMLIFRNLGKNAVFSRERLKTTFILNSHVFIDPFCHIHRHTGLKKTIVYFVKDDFFSPIFVSFRSNDLDKQISCSLSPIF